MLGRTHVLSGAALYNALTLAPANPIIAAHPGLATRGAYTVLAAGAAALCDLDQCGSTVARTFGPVSETIALAIHVATGGHREGTHSIVGDIGFVTATFVSLATLGIMSGHTIAARVGYAAAAIVLGAILTFIFASALQALDLTDHITADLIAVTATAYVITEHARVHGVVDLPVAVLIGVTAHMLGDMLTDHGCPLGWPWSERCWHLTPRWARFATGTWPEHAIAIGLTAALAWFAWDLTGLAALIHHLVTAQP